jgi:hypothetical protein
VRTALPNRIGPPGKKQGGVCLGPQADGQSTSIGWGPKGYCFIKALHDSRKAAGAGSVLGLDWMGTAQSRRLYCLHARLSGVCRLIAGFAVENLTKFQANDFEARRGYHAVRTACCAAVVCSELLIFNQDKKIPVHAGSSGRGRVARNSDGYPSRQSRFLLPENCERFCPQVNSCSASRPARSGASRG